MVRRVFIAIVLAVFGVTAATALPGRSLAVYAQKKDDGKKKAPPGPPVVKPKQPQGSDKKGDDKSRPKDKKPD